MPAETSGEFGFRRTDNGWMVGEFAALKSQPASILTLAPPDAGRKNQNHFHHGREALAESSPPAVVSDESARDHLRLS